MTESPPSDHPPPEGEGESPLAKLRRRKVGQWGILYAAGAWGFLQGLEYVTDTFLTSAMGLSEQPSAFEGDYHAPLSSRRFEGMLINRQWNLGEIITNIQKVEAGTTQLLERLESRRVLL